jgi:hypothetical protein
VHASANGNVRADLTCELLECRPLREVDALGPVGIHDAIVVRAMEAFGTRALAELQDEPDSVELAGLTPTIFEHVNPLGTYWPAPR